MKILFVLAIITIPLSLVIWIKNVEKEKYLRIGKRKVRLERICSIICLLINITNVIIQIFFNKQYSFEIGLLSMLMAFISFVIFMSSGMADIMFGDD